jgi:hypothetical protein
MQVTTIAGNQVQVIKSNEHLQCDGELQLLMADGPAAEMEMEASPMCIHSCLVHK